MRSFFAFLLLFAIVPALAGDTVAQPSGAPAQPRAEPLVRFRAEVKWVEPAGQLLDGLPDEALADGDVPDSFTATLRPYQRRGPPPSNRAWVPTKCWH